MPFVARVVRLVERRFETTPYGSSGRSATSTRQVGAVSKRVAKQLGKWVPYGAPAEGALERAATAGKAESKRSRRKFTASSGLRSRSA